MTAAVTSGRDELAARCLVSLLTRDGYDGAGAARDAVAATDALLAALRPASPVAGAPSASTIDGAVDAYFAHAAKSRPVPPASDTPPAAPTPYVPTRAERGAAGYVPQVGDKIRHSDGRVVILTAPRANCHFGSWDSFVLVGDKRLECVPVPTDSSWWTYLGPATAAERAAAGLAEDGSVGEATTPIRTVSPNVVDRTPPAAALTEEERADLRDAIWKERTAWLATGADQRSEPDVYANAAAAWFAKRDGTVKP